MHSNCAVNVSQREVNIVTYYAPLLSVPCPLFSREQPIYTTRAHVFQIDPTTKKNWVPASKQAVTVSYFYDSTRNSYRIISVDACKVRVCVCVCVHALAHCMYGCQHILEKGGR